MKRYLVFLVLVMVVFIPVLLFAQSAKVIDVQGDVKVKMGNAPLWSKLQLSTSLNKDSEIKTGKGGTCTLAFDRKSKNIVTIKENSQVRLDSIIPGDVYLKEGRVFTLVKDLKKGEQFQIKTPAAVAGARGTGWSTSSQGGETTVLSFDDIVYLVTKAAEQNLASGNGVNIDVNGILGEIFPLTDKDREEWQDFINYLNKLVEAINKGSETGGPSLEDLKQEGRDDFGDLRGEMRRQEQEERSNGRNENEEPGGPGTGEVVEPK